MARPFSELRDKMPKERRESAEQRTRAVLAEMALRELRETLKLSQEQLARELDVKQSSLSKLERRTDMHISSLRKVIEAMGGELLVLARFPEGDILIRQIEDQPEMADEAVVR